MKGYTTKSAVENYLMQEIDDLFDDQLEEWIEAIEEYMDNEADRVLGVEDDAEASDYAYNGTGKHTLMIDDFVDIDTITLDGEDITDSVFLYPANSTPTWKLESDDYVFAKGRQNVVVTGVQGYREMQSFPKDLKLAATVLVAGIFNAANNLDGEVKSESIGVYTVTYVTDSQKNDFELAKKILQKYRRIR